MMNVRKKTVAALGSRRSARGKRTPKAALGDGASVGGMVTMDSGPIDIKPGKAGQLIVRVPYSAERLAKIKMIAGGLDTGGGDKKGTFYFSARRTGVAAIDHVVAEPLSPSLGSH